MAEKKIGKVTHYYRKINVAGIKLSGTLKVGDIIRVTGHTTDFEQQVTSMELDHRSIVEGKARQEIGLKVAERVRQGDTVYLIEGE